MTEDRLTVINVNEIRVPDDVLMDIYKNGPIPGSRHMAEFLSTRPTASKEEYAEAMRTLYEEHPDNTEAKIAIIRMMMIDLQYSIKDDEV